MNIRFVSRENKGGRDTWKVRTPSSEDLREPKQWNSAVGEGFGVYSDCSLVGLEIGSR